VPEQPVTPEQPATEVVRNDERSRYEVLVDGRVVGHSDFHVEGTHVVFVHTEIDPDYRGQDLAARLVVTGLDEARRNGHTVVPICPYVRSYIQDHPEYADLLDT